MPPYSNNNETPMAVINTAILGAFRSGRYAAFSIIIPAIPATAMAISRAGKKDKPRVVVAKKPT